VLRRLSLRDVAIVAELEVELGGGFTVLTGETGAGKSILVDALQLALGGRGDAGLVREGAARAEVSAGFDVPPALRPWLDEQGFALADDALLLRRVIDAGGKSRAWINGSAATAAQLREAAELLVEIHGQHAWQGLTRPAAVRGLLDAQAGVDPAPLAAAWAGWRAALARLEDAGSRRDSLERERERLAWQIGELDRLAPGADEWDPLNAEHQRLAHGQALLDGAQAALAAIDEDEAGAATRVARAAAALAEVLPYDSELREVADMLAAAGAQLEDAARTLHGYLGRREPDPDRLAALDSRLGAWVALARRYRRAPADLPALLAGWKEELQGLDAAADLEALERAAAQAEQAWRTLAEGVSHARRRAAPALAQAVTAAMQQLGMAGGRFEVALVPQAQPQSFGLETVELQVAGHAGSTPRPLARVASGGELSRLALAVAVTTAAAGRAAGTAAPTLIFDEVDAGIGGPVAASVGRLMKQLGAEAQVLAVTHLAQVAACADHHFVVAKSLQEGRTLSCVQAVEGEARVAEVARMLGGESLSGTAHAQALLRAPSGPAPAPAGAAPGPAGANDPGPGAGGSERSRAAGPTRSARR
jgi:DNA repair protein RecN (Recombination protein N)